MEMIWQLSFIYKNAFLLFACFCVNCSVIAACWTYCTFSLMNTMVIIYLQSLTYQSHPRFTFITLSLSLTLISHSPSINLLELIDRSPLALQQVFNKISECIFSSLNQNKVVYILIVSLLVSMACIAC